MANDYCDLKGKVLVTGGAGFIGSHLAEALVSAGASVSVIDDLSTGSRENLDKVSGRIEFINGDLYEAIDSGKIKIGDFSYIFHLAANPYVPPSVENPAFDFKLNLRNTFTLLEAMRACGSKARLVNISSAAVYGNPVLFPIKETDPAVPIAPYGVSKLAAERYVEVYSKLYGISACSLRFFPVYGPRQRKQVVYDIFRKIKNNPAQIEIFGDGTQSRDFTYVLDMVQALILAACRALCEGEVYNVASGSTYTVKELVSVIADIFQASPAIVYTGKVRPGDADKWFVDTEKFKALGFSPRHSLVEGLRATGEWFLKDSR